ncbi:hypothetical protein R1sor_008697 [Riccia sorocarpa]|uniref:Uncharacterized protein n=1 Tax=Riccia sorocarpa TaxID=122646 RepID=A0ABD3HW82_9MARC
MSDFMQMDNAIVKPMDLLSRKLLILDVEGLLFRNTLWDYTHYLFSGEQYDKFLFMWDYYKALDTKEKWMRDTD